jgi:hypothetical protein
MSVRERRLDTNPVVLSLPILVFFSDYVDVDGFRLITFEICKLNFDDAVVRNNAIALKLTLRMHVSDFS